MVSFENGVTWKLSADSASGIASNEGSEKVTYWRLRHAVDAATVTREALAYERGLVEGSLDERDKFHGHRTPKSSLPDNIRSARGALVVILCHVYYVSIQPSARAQRAKIGTFPGASNYIILRFVVLIG